MYINTVNMEISFQNRVVVITGAGSGLGRAYALELARRGAKVLVNDINRSNADIVVKEIHACNGQALADYNSVTLGEKIIQAAISHFGRIDVLINNAGFLRDVTFAKMTESQWDEIYDVHLKGVFKCTHAAWKYMMDQNYGRIVNVSSIAGLYGNVGQVNYSTMKAALTGFTKSLAKEGKRYNIKVNCIAPLAASPLTARLIPDEIKSMMSPEHVAPIVTLLSHETCEDTGQVMEIAAGWISKVRYQRSHGIYLRPPFTAEEAHCVWSQTEDFSRPDYPQEMQETVMICIKNFNNQSKL